MVTPLGKNAEETFERASRGESGIDYISTFDTTHLPCQIGGQVKEAWLEGPDPEAERYYKFSSRGLRLMRKATLEATERARLDEIRGRERIGVSFGFHGDSPAVEDIVFLHRFYDGNGTWNMEDLMRAGGYSPLNFLRRKPDVATTILPKLLQVQRPHSHDRFSVCRRFPGHRRSLPAHPKQYVDGYVFKEIFMSYLLVQFLRIAAHSGSLPWPWP